MKTKISELRLSNAKRNLIVDDKTIKEKTCFIRGKRVMLNADLQKYKDMKLKTLIDR